MKHALLFVLLGPVASALAMAKTCEELAAEIAAKLDAKGVQNYSLEIVPNALAAGENVVGSCDRGSKKIIYIRTKAPAASAPSASATTSAPESVPTRKP